uniref:Uncharacterized protein n=1 Tax=Timema cristinae TaxID=61476 RepID=A0A7R9H7E7_TIMCR|nr:unnamed protein product [Timema cristinae]
METCDISLVKQEIVELIKTEPQNENEFDTCGQSGIKTEDESDTSNSVDDIVKTEIKQYDSSLRIMNSNIDHFTLVDKSEEDIVVHMVGNGNVKLKIVPRMLFYEDIVMHMEGDGIVKLKIVQRVLVQEDIVVHMVGDGNVKLKIVLRMLSPWMDFNNTLKFNLDKAGITLTKIPHDDWLWKVGLRSGFLQILVSKDTQRFTGIYYRRQKYSATHLSMGHALAPSILQNIAQEGIDYIKELDPSIGGIAYLENFLFHVTNPGTLEHIPEILMSLGFTTNKEKSSPKPLKQPTYFEFKIDTSSSTYKLTPVAHA